MAYAQIEKQHLHKEIGFVAVGILLGALSIAFCLVLGSRLLRKQPKIIAFGSTENKNVTETQQVIQELTICCTIFSTLDFLAGILKVHSLPCWVTGTNCLLFGSQFLNLNLHSKAVAFSAFYLLVRLLLGVPWRSIFTKLITSLHTLLSTSSDQSRREKSTGWKRSLNLTFKHLVRVPVVLPNRRVTRSDPIPSTDQ